MIAPCPEPGRAPVRSIHRAQQAHVQLPSVALFFRRSQRYPLSASVRACSSVNLVSRGLISMNFSRGQGDFGKARIVPHSHSLSPLQPQSVGARLQVLHMVVVVHQLDKLAFSVCRPLNEGTAAQLSFGYEKVGAEMVRPKSFRIALAHIAHSLTPSSVRCSD